MRHSSKTLLLATACLLASGAYAQFAKPEDAIKYRKASFTVMGAHWARLAAMAQGRVPYDAKAAADNALVLDAVHRLPSTAFGPDTQQGDTKAKPDIWKEPAKFKAAEDKFLAGMSKVVAAAKSGKPEELKEAFASNGGVCKNCHDDFRQ